MRGKVLLLRRGTLLLILTALVAAGIFMAVGGPGFVSASAAKRQLPIYSVEREEKVCAISFDAAWGNEDTQMQMCIRDSGHTEPSPCRRRHRWRCCRRPVSYTHLN